MISLLPKRHRREPFSLQLTAMIDIFAMIVIFLIKGTVMGVNDVPIPEAMRLPTSISKESVESAPRVVIGKGEVSESMFSNTIPLESFLSDGGGRADGKIVGLKKQLRGYIAGLAPEARKSGVLLNVLADQATPYRHVFDVVKVYREAGFEALLFVAQGPSEEPVVKEAK